MKWVVVASALGACVSEEAFVAAACRSPEPERRQSVKRDGLVLNREVLNEGRGRSRWVDFKVLTVHTTFAHTDWADAMGVTGCRNGRDGAIAESD